MNDGLQSEPTDGSQRAWRQRSVFACVVVIVVGVAYIIYRIIYIPLHTRVSIHIYIYMYILLCYAVVA